MQDVCNVLREHSLWVQPVKFEQAQSHLKGQLCFRLHITAAATERRGRMVSYSSLKLPSKIDDRPGICVATLKCTAMKIISEGRFFIWRNYICIHSVGLIAACVSSELAL